jgi:spore coat protein H
MIDNYKHWQESLGKPLPRRRFLSLVAAAGAGSALIACTGDKDEPQGSDASGAATSDNETANEGRPAGWTAASHSNDADPDYDMVFPKDAVNQMTITVSPENWQVMLDDMTQLFGARGTNRGGQGGQGGAPGGGFGAPPGGGGPGGGDFSRENPVWVPGTIGFNGKTWTQVGVRFKGNSSLRSSWGNGTDKLPFKLDFDEFENDYPEIDNQRFYGFKQLSLGNNFGDATGMRERIAYDAFGAAGLVAANTGFYDIVLDYGQGAKSLGLYTAIEVVDDTVITRSFKDDSGNIYEAEGNASSLAAGVIDRIPASFQVESDDAKADWTDIKALYSHLQSDQRTNEPSAWRQQLEKLFDVDVFLEWMAISTLLQHWDTYGGMTHNFYLYNDPATGKLVFITWDHNLVLGASAGMGGNMPAGGDMPAFGNVPPGGNVPGGGPGMGGGRMNTSFDKSAVGANWPLISFLWAQPEYRAKYHAYLKDAIEGAFEPSKVTASIQSLAAKLEPTATRASTSEAYQTAVSSLTATVQARVQATRDYLATI